MMDKKSTKPPALTWADYIRLLKSYFIKSDNRTYAWLLLSGIILSVIAIVGLTFAINWWFLDFWAVFEAGQFIPFVFKIGEFLGILSSITLVSMGISYLSGNLSISWRLWLTADLLDKYLVGKKNYLDLRRENPEIDNPAQRVQEDVKIFVDSSITLSSNLLRSALTLIAFTGTLWVVGGSLSFVLFGVQLVIPGYLVWCSLLMNIISSLATQYIGSSLGSLNQNASSADADLREDLIQISEDAENIALEGAEDYYQSLLSKRLQTIKTVGRNKVIAETQLFTFSNFYRILIVIAPYIITAPLYFNGMIALAQVMQINMAFHQVHEALNWFLVSYMDIAKYQASIIRVHQYEQGLEPIAVTSTANILHKFHNEDTIEVKTLHLVSPRDRDHTILQGISFKLEHGKHTLIKGPSGIGKSTLFKAIARTWRHGSGEINVPSGKKIVFLPQKPTLPNDTLKAVLSYPQPDTTYQQSDYERVLRDVGGMEDFITQLDQTKKWDDILSGGQKQKIGFARALLKKPDWLFLDEPSASLDKLSEKKLYSLITSMSNTTVVSIGHDESVKDYHQRILFFNCNDESKYVSITEESALAFEAL